MELTAEAAGRYLGHALGQLLAVADRLGDDLVSQRPLGEHTNAVASLTIHTCGVIEFWLGHVACGRASDRDRTAEFSATATVDELRALVERTLAQAAEDLASIEAGGVAPHELAALLPGGDSDASLVLHVIEEAYQHLGHAELAADALLG